MILLNGPSSSGKSSIAKAIQEQAQQPFLHIGIDKMIGMMPAKLNNWEGGFAPEGFCWEGAIDAEGHSIQKLHVGPFAKKINETYYEIVVSLARLGHYLVIDEVAFGAQAIGVWKEKLKGFNTLYVGIKTPLSILEQREKERGDRILGSARAQSMVVHQGVHYDLEFNSSQSSPEEIAQEILKHF
ncbi:MAG: chloramphenicol phosphotransferase [Chlamydiales bacterium]|jgi:chloramphenicol 3-O phosphotransferase|nr:chloramphenicol phosphotransferase [Chlamydiales bacterium]